MLHQLDNNKPRFEPQPHHYLLEYYRIAMKAFLLLIIAKLVCLARCGSEFGRYRVDIDVLRSDGVVILDDRARKRQTERKKTFDWQLKERYEDL